VHPSYLEVFEGDSLNFSCDSDSHPKYVPVTWGYDRGTINEKPYYQGSNQLQIDSAQFQHTGRYSCFGLDSTEYFVSHAYLFVLGRCTCYYYQYILYYCKCVYYSGHC